MRLNMIGIVPGLFLKHVREKGHSDNKTRQHRPHIVDIRCKGVVNGRFRKKECCNIVIDDGRQIQLFGPRFEQEQTNRANDITCKV